MIKDYCRNEIKERASKIKIRQYSTDLELYWSHPFDHFIHHDLYNYYDFENNPHAPNLYTVSIRPDRGDYKKAYMYNERTDEEFLYVESHDYPEPLGILRYYYNDNHILYRTEYVHPQKRVQQCTHNLKIKHWSALKNP